MDVHEKEGEAAGEVAEEAFGQGAQMAFYIVGKVLVVVFLGTDEYEYM